MPNVVFSGGDSMIPMARDFANHGCGVVSLYPPDADRLNNADIKAVPLASMVDSIVSERSNYEAAYAIRDILDGLQDNEAFKLLDPDMVERVQYLVPSYLIDNLKNLAMVVLCLDKLKPSGIVLHNDVESIPRMAALWAKARGVPCLHLPHAVYLEQKNRAPVGCDVHDLVTSSHLACAGWFQRQWYFERGFPSDHIFEVGVPRMDKMCAMLREPERVYSIFHLNPKWPTVVYASSWWQGTSITEYEDLVRPSFVAFLETAKRVDGINWVVKLHPRAPKENDDWHVEAIKQSGVKAILIKEYLELIFQVANALVMYGPSNIAFEAGIMGVQLVSINGFHNDSEVTTVGIDPDEIGNGMKNALTNKVPLQSFLLKYIGVHDGQSTKRALEYAHGLFKV
jgi:hypothetical protein